MKEIPILYYWYGDSKHYEAILLETKNNQALIALLKTSQPIVSGPSYEMHELLYLKEQYPANFFPLRFNCSHYSKFNYKIVELDTCKTNLEFSSEELNTILLEEITHNTLINYVLTQTKSF